MNTNSTYNPNQDKQPGQYLPDQTERLTKPFLGRLYLTGYNGGNKTSLEYGAQAAEALRKAGYDVQMGAVYEYLPPTREFIRDCDGVATTEGSMTPVNKWLGVESAYAAAYGRDYYPVEWWLKEAQVHNEKKHAEAVWKAQEAEQSRAAWEVQETAYFRKRDEQEAEERARKVWEDKNGQQWKTLAEVEAMVNKSSAQQGEEVNLCGGDYSDDPEGNDVDEAVMKVWVEITQDGFISVKKNIWATDVHVLVEYL